MSGSAENFIGTADGKGPGVLYAPNLTPGGMLKSLTDGQIARGVREGIGQANTPLLVMPSRNFHAMADSDLADLLGYMRSQPAVEHTLPPKKINVLGYLILGAGQFPLSDQPPITGAVGAPAESPSRQYGAYLTPMIGCRECHGDDYRGLPTRSHAAPGGPSLLAVVHAQPLEVFQRAVREGIGADGRALDPSKMPWPSFQSLTDTEILAVYEYLKSLPDAPAATP
jgi:mono/diheme cytochrome c family protein